MSKQMEIKPCPNGCRPGTNMSWGHRADIEFCDGEHSTGGDLQCVWCPECEYAEIEFY